MKRKHLLTTLCLTAFFLLIGSSGWAQANVNDILWSENWTGGTTQTPSAYLALEAHSGTTVYGDATISYSSADGGTATRLYNEKLAGGTKPELLLSKSNGTWTIGGIPTGGATEMQLSFKTNKTTSNLTITSTTSGITISAGTTISTGTTKGNWYLLGYTITATSSITTFDLTLKNTSGGNARIDDVVLKVTESGAADETAPTPTLASIVPANGATGIALHTNLTIPFSENVVPGTGNITISGGAKATQTIDVTSGHVTIDGSTVTIDNEAFTLAGETNYTVSVPAGAFKDAAGNEIATFSWNFTTASADVEAPTIVSVTPNNAATDVAITSPLTITFSEAVQKGTGSITISGITIDVATSTDVTIDGATVTVANAALSLASETEYTVTIPAGAFTDLAGNALESNYSWSFTTAAVDVYERITSLAQLTPGKYVFYGVNGTNTGAMTNTISGGRLGNTLVTVTDGKITSPDESIIWTIAGNETDGFTVYNEATSKYCEITTNSTSGFALNSPSTHTYSVSVIEGDCRFISNHASAGGYMISMLTTDWRPYLPTNRKPLYLYKLVGPDLTAPVATLAPANGATNVAVDANMTITFDEAISLADGTEITNDNASGVITLKKGETTLEASSYAVTIDDDKKVITIDPTENLDGNTAYTLTLNNEAVADANGNKTATVSSTFTTVDPFAPILTLTGTYTGKYYWDDMVDVTWSQSNCTGTGSIVVYKDGTEVARYAISDITAGAASIKVGNNNTCNANSYGADYTLKVLWGEIQTEASGMFTVIPTPTLVALQQQNTEGASNYTGDIVRISGIVTAVASGNFYMQSGATAAEWNGMYVYKYSHGKSVGDLVTVEGLVQEYDGLTEIGGTVTISDATSTGNATTPVATTTAAASTENYESVLVKVTRATFNGTNLNDGSGNLAKNTLFNYEFTEGRVYDVTGVIGYSSSKFQIQPRSADDIRLYDNDATLSAFTFGSGENVTNALELEGVETETGATKNIGSAPLTNFVGIVATPTSSSSNVDVKVGDNIIAPENLSTYNFSEIHSTEVTVTATVTAEDGTAKIYKVVIIRTLSGENQITAYSLNGQTGESTFSENTISVKIPYGETKTRTATFTLSEYAFARVGSTDQVSGETENDFTSPVTYTVIAQNNSSREWTVNVSYAPNTATDITTFNIGEFIGSCNAETHRISITVPYGTDVTTLTPSSIVLSHGATISPAQDEAQDFTSPVTYTVTAEDGSTVQTWTATVTVAANTANEITSFSLAGTAGTISGTDITVDIPFSTNDLTTLVATFDLSAEAAATVGVTAQVSGTTPNDFTSPVTYTVTAEDGTSIQEYTVTVRNTETNFLTFTLPSQVGTTAIDAENHTIAAQITYNKDITAQTPTFTLSAQATAKVGVTPQVSGTTTNDFTSPVTYTVTSGNGTVQDWTITITKAAEPNHGAAITAYSINDVNGTIDADAHTVAVELPYGTPINALKPVFTISGGATIKIGDDTQQSGITEHDFTTDGGVRTYTVTAEDGETTQDWTVTVTVRLASTGNAFTSFTVAGINATIDGEAHTISATVPYGTAVDALIATFVVSENATVAIEGTPQVSGETTNDFTSTVPYTVTSQSGAEQVWNVTITIAANTANDFTSFTLTGILGEATINTTNHTITANVNNVGSSLELAATFTLSAEATATIGGNTQESGTTINNFLTPVTYTVTSQSGASQDWLVTITNTAKEFTSFKLANVEGTIETPNINVTVPYGTDMTNLVAEFLLSAQARAEVNETAQTSLTTENNFTSPVTYKVFAGDNSTKIWTVTATMGADDVDPNWVEDYPKIGTTTTTDITVKVKLDEPGKVFYKITATDATQPTVSEVIADNNFITVAEANEEYTATINGLTAETEYKIYLVAQDAAGTPNVQDATTAITASTLGEAPVIAAVSHTPESDILATTTVSVSAEITGTVTSASLNWGVASDALVNTITMSHVSGNTYTTVSDIPAQADGTNVYYQVVSTNAFGNSSSEVATYHVGIDVYELITSLDQLTPGKYVFYGVNGTNTGAMTNTISGSRLGNTSVTVTDGKITSPDESIIWTIAGNETDSFTVYNEATDKYCEIITNSTSGFALNNPSTHTYSVSVTDGDFMFKSNHASAGERCISIFKTDWRPYASSGKYPLHLYKLAGPDLTAPVATLAPANGATNVAVDANMTITFNEAIKLADGTEITNDNASGVITLKKGETTLEATSYAVTIDDDKKVITIDPTENLDGNTAYTLTLNNEAVADANGNTATAVSSTFTTVDLFAPILTLTGTYTGKYYWNDMVDVTWSQSNCTGTGSIVVYKGGTEVTRYTVDDITADTASIKVGNNTTCNADSYGADYTLKVLCGEIQTEASGMFTVIPTPTLVALQQENSEGASNYTDDIVRISGIITATRTGNFYMQSGVAAAEWDGMYIYKSNHGKSVGDLVTVEGKVMEYNGLTEIGGTVTISDATSTGNATTPVATTTAAASTENYESVLVKVTRATFNGTNLNDGSGNLEYKNTLFDTTFVEGRVYDVTGVIGWYNNGSVFQILPRSADDIRLYSNDATLATLTIGGENAIALSDINTVAGATLRFDDFTGLNGITATPNDTLSTVSVTVNNVAVAASDLGSQALAQGDVIEITVTAEDGNDLIYKVTLAGNNRTLEINAIATTAYSTGDELTITWTSEDISNVNITAVADSAKANIQLNAEPVVASAGTFSYTIPNGVFGTYKIMVSDADDATFSSTSAETLTFTDNMAPTITVAPVSGSTVNPSFDLTFTSNEAVTLATGTITIKKAIDNSTALTLTQADATLSGNVVTVPVEGLEYSTNYYVNVTAGLITDLSDNASAAIESDSVWTLTTSESTPMDLFFSEYIEGSSSNKAIEIYNPTTSAVDLSNYMVKMASNGGLWSNTLTFPNGKTLSSKDVYVIANSGANSVILSSSDTTSTVTYFNGDDAIGLFKIAGGDTTLIDVFGKYQEDPGAAWAVAGISNATSDHTILRKLSITSGNIDWVASAGTTAENSEWIVKDKDDFTNIGIHGESSEAEILTFSFAEQTGDATINSEAGTITAEVEFAADITALTPTFTISSGATVSPASGVAQNFTSPVTYTVTAENESTKSWTVTVTKAAASAENDITSFAIGEYAGVINAEAHTIAVELPNGMSVDALAPTIAISEFATISPAADSTLDFTSPVTYTVTAQDGSTQNWVVTVTVDVELSTDAAITSFAIDDVQGVINADAHTVEITLPASYTDLTSLVPTIAVSYGATISPASGVAQDFTNAVTYTVTAQDTTVSQEWTVTATIFNGELFFSEYIEGSSNNKAIEIYNPTANPVDLSNYVVKLSNNGLGYGMSAAGNDSRYVLPLSGTIAPNDVYVIANSYANAIILGEADLTLGFSDDSTAIGTNVITFNGNDAVGLFKNDILVDAFGVEIGTDLPYFTVAGVAEAGKDHTILRKLSITSGNPDWAASAGTTAENSEWVVKDKDDFTNIGIHEARTEAEILTFSFAEQFGASVINSTNATVSVEVLYGTNLNGLVPTITISEGATISPLSNVAQDFTNAVTYTVTAEDGTTKVWTVNVSVVLFESNENDIISFSINSVEGTIDSVAHTVSLEMPYGTELDSLVPTITVSSGATINPASGVAQDFTNAVNYTVTAQDNTEQVWVVTVTEASLQITSIYDIQYSADTTASPMVGQVVTTKGIVTAFKWNSGNNKGNFAIQDGTTPYSGVYIYAGTTQVALGDSVVVTGTVKEYNGLTEIDQVSSIVITSSNNAIPAPIVVSTQDANLEGYESMLVKVNNATFNASNLNDGTGDLATYTTFYSFSLVDNSVYNVTGVMGAYNKAQICPRSESDIEIVSGGEIELTSIYDIQYTEDASGDSPMSGMTIKTKGIVTASIWADSYNNGNFTIQDGNSQFNGLYVYRCSTPVAVGDSVIVIGSITEYNGLTEVAQGSTVTIINSDNTLPEPIEVSTLDAAGEGYESMLVKVNNATATVAEDGSVTVDDGTGALAIRPTFYTYQFVDGTHYNIVGVMGYYNAAQLCPRSEGDVSVIDAIDDNPFAEFRAFPNPFKNEIRFNGASISRVTVTSIIGQVVMDVTTTTGETLNTNDLTTGIYMVRFIDVNGQSTVLKMIKK